MIDMVQRAKDIGFEIVASVSAEQIVCKQELRDLCNADSCPNFATCWSCPPGAGEFEACVQRIATSGGGVLLQTVRHDVDFSDRELLDEIRDIHNGRLDELADSLRAEQDGVLEFTTGGCNICGECSYPDAPCKQPDKQRLALSAHGVDVTETCRNAEMEYDFQDGTIRFMGMILLS